MAEHMTKRKQQALDTKARIQAVALDLFRQYGIENVSIEEIARTAGCSVGNIYRYFRSKDELTVYVTSHVDEEYLKIETEYFDGESCNLSGTEKLTRFMESAMQICSEETVIDKTFIYSLRHPDRDVLRINERTYFRILRRLTSACKEEGSIAPAHNVEKIVDTLVTVHRGVLLEWLICEKDFNPVKKVRFLTDLVLKGLRPDV